jgi:hypothetical protein
MGMPKELIAKEIADAQIKCRQLSMRYCILCECQGSIIKHFCSDDAAKRVALDRYDYRRGKLDITPETKPIFSIDISGRVSHIR